MKRFIKRITEDYIVKWAKKVPGEERFGNYRFLPFFFLFGATLEYLMINLRVGPNKVNFYTTLKKRQAERIIQEKEDLERVFAANKQDQS